HDRPISIHEFFYPLMQGYDSVAVKADVEIGATEQKFNLLIARHIQKEYKQKPQVILTLPILEGIDGTQRMSKTTGNYIGIDESPDQMFGKTMSIPDELIYKYFVLLTDLKPSELDEIERLLGEKSVNPMVLKRRLARKLVSLYHSEEKALIAEKDFDRVFRYKKVPLKIREFSPSLKNNKIWIVKLLCLSGLASSNSEAKRLIKQGGVRIDGEQVVDENLELEKGSEFILNVGKRRFVKIIL
ncbi:MAG: tyrosine--tRNA ligase, partial [Fidelibacterota bacterium]